MLETLGLTWAQLAMFMVAGIVLNLTPGPDVVYVVTHALRRGARAGIVAGLGITAGCFVHIGAAAVGLSALLTASTTAFTVLKWVGAIYLLWMGLRMLRSSAPANPDLVTSATEAHEPTLRRVFLGGFLTNVLNPKVALFFLAFVPQFIPASVPDKALAFVLLGSLFNLNSVWVSVAYALLAAQFARRAAVVRRSMHRLEKIAGLAFLAFGIRLALFENPSH